MNKGIPVGDFFFVLSVEGQEEEDLRAIFRLPQGRRLIRRLLSMGNVMSPTMATDSRTTEYYNGLQALGLRLATETEMAVPGAVAQLLQESTNDRLANDAAAKNRRKKNV